MRLLIFEWAAGTFTYNDIIESFTANGITYRTVSYQFDDKNEDEFFVRRFTKVLKEDSYDAVFSVNYFPLVAVCCHNCNLPYISWSYDNPLDVPDVFCKTLLEKVAKYKRTTLHVQKGQSCKDLRHAWCR